MEIVELTENNIRDAGKIHSESWKESHKNFCSEEFVARHTEEAQTEYIQNGEMFEGDIPIKGQNLVKSFIEQYRKNFL